MLLRFLDSLVCHLKRLFLLFDPFITEDRKVKLQRKPGRVTGLKMLSQLDALVVTLETSFDAFLMALALAYLGYIPVIIPLQLHKVDHSIGVALGLCAWV
jgi:hypothetical protein